MATKKTPGATGSKEAVKVIRVVSCALHYNSDGRSVAVKTVVMADGRQHTFTAPLDLDAEEILLYQVDRLMAYV